MEEKAILAMEEMEEEGIPVEGFEDSGDKGFDFLFARGLSPSEVKKAQTIAEKHLPTKYSWHNDNA